MDVLKQVDGFSIVQQERVTLRHVRSGLTADVTLVAFTADVWRARYPGEVVASSFRRDLWEVV